MATDAEINYVQDYIGIGHSVDSTRIGRLIDAASKVIEAWVGYLLMGTSASWTEDYDGTGENKLITRHIPISSITSIKIAADREFDSVAALLAIEYTFEAAPGIIVLLSQGFGLAPQSVRIIYTGGLVTIPDEVLTARAMIVAVMRNRAKAGADGFISEGLGAYRAQYDDKAIPEVAKTLLSTYKNWQI